MKRQGTWVLAAGQIWHTGVATIEILRLGKHLIHYRITKHAGHKRVSAQISARGALEQYLRNNGARLNSAGCLA